jgi:hypothetical protein
MLKTVFIICGLICSSFLFSQDKDTSFTLCDGVQTWPYYFPDLKIKGDFWEVKKHYNMEYPLSLFQNLKNNTGIITVQFKVNCKGEMGDFSTQQCDFTYKPNVVDKRIIDYFLARTKTLTGWVPGKNEEGEIVNHHKFFSFRIKEGVLIQILPK